MKLVNIASLDPVIIDSGRTGLSQASKADRELWQELEQDRKPSICNANRR